MIRGLILAITIFISASTAALSNGVEAAANLFASEIAQRINLADPNNEIRVEVMKGKDYLVAINPSTLKMMDLKLEENKGSFAALVMVEESITLEVNGRFSQITQVPVPARKLSRNDVITSSDIIFAEIDTRKLKRGYITDEAELIGKSPVRGILEGRPVLPTQIAMPASIKKQQSLTISYRNNVLHIESLGQAMEDGAIGETIRVKNLASNKVIYAKILDESTAEVQPVTSIASNNEVGKYAN